MNARWSTAPSIPYALRTGRGGAGTTRAVQVIREAERGRSSLTVLPFAQIWATSHSYKGGVIWEIEWLTIETEAIIYICSEDGHTSSPKQNRNSMGKEEGRE